LNHNLQHTEVQFLHTSVVSESIQR